VREGRGRMIQFLTSNFSCKEGGGEEKWNFANLLFVVVFGVRMENERG
jgi:hypothetical protein